ncbi:PKD domain-containing protein [Algoriphagus algorifonticola]|uniref:PKD domain-containing protein n=1 Tax=Algoriphagus algorifonticola TaxID=2593007 RepID=UPI0011A65307|nr:PKD domain-containing protein [Algoriphagus algorifonticola]
MRKFYLTTILLIIFLAKSSLSFAQLSTVGKEFWVGFMDNNRVPPSGNSNGAPDFAVLILTASENSTGTIEYLGQSVSFSMTAGQQYTLRVPSEDLDLLHRNSATTENKGIYISSTGKIAVHAYNERFRSADGTVVLPVGALGTDYYITSHYETLTADVNFNGNINDESAMLVIATEDNTQIEITTSVNTLGGGNPGVPFSINLNRGQSYQLKAKEDMTGTRVRVIGENANECKKIAVFGGNKWTSVGNCGAANDHLFQQAYPVNTWGTSFVHVALSGRTSGELVKVLGSEDNTDVRVNGVSVGTVNRGTWIPIEFGINESGKIETSKPSSVTVFSKSQACNQQNSPNANTGDPFMITYSPSEQFLKDLTFQSLALPSIVNHYVNIVVKAGTQNSTILDGQNIGALFSSLPGDSDFQYARVNISQGVHRLSNPEGFAAYAYGFGDLESYGYAAGAALDNLNFKTESEYEFDVQGENIACLNQVGDWIINSENPDFTYFVWNFGDGSDIQEGAQVTHTFTEPGEYEVSVLAAISPNSCDQREEVTFSVTVLETEGELLGAESVCPDVEELIYSFKAIENVSRVEFEVEGGEIIETTDNSVLINWGPANDAAFVKATPYSLNGCPGEPVIKSVIINQRIEAEDPDGIMQVCFDPNVYYTYSAPNASSGRGYTWTVTGGEIVSGQGSSEIEVSWNQPGVLGAVSYKVFSLVDELCEGESSEIEVKVEDEFVVNVARLLPISCSGLNSGEIGLEVIGGVAPYTFEWSHDSGLASADALELVAGLYSVKVTDQLGCERLLENLEIIQPEPLAIQSISPVGTSCFGKPDGAVSFTITGGVAPYAIDYQGLNTFNGSVTLSGMPQGVYSWELLDANGCSIPLDFEITSPIALEVDVRMEKPACPGGSNGELFAFPAGGVGPYVYTWEFQSTLGNQLLAVPKGNYAVSVTDGSGCVSLGEGIVEEAEPEVRLPTGYFPQRDKDLFEGISNCELQFQLWIYDRWGQLIYTGTEGWDGTVSGVNAPSGTYSYVFQYSFLLEDELKVENKSGAFALIR